MKKYFLYELKKCLLPTLIFTIITSVIYILSLTPFEFIDSQGYAYRSNVVGVQVMLMILCTVTPILNFSFKAKAREVDLWYSLPIRREKLYGIKGAISALQALIPYTIAYWLGFLIIVCSPNKFFLINYLWLYLISVALSVSLIGVNAFVLTRANNVIDGLVNILCVACLGAMFVLVLEFFVDSYLTDFSFWFTYSPITATTTMFDQLIEKGEFVISEYYSEYGHLIRENNNFKLVPLMHAFFGVIGAASWFGLLYTSRIEKAENAERISNNIIGYKTFIPIYVCLIIIACIGALDSWGILGLAIIAASGLAMYFAYRRSFKITKEDIISLCAAIIIGVIFATLKESWF